MSTHGMAFEAGTPVRKVNELFLVLWLCMVLIALGGLATTKAHGYSAGARWDSDSMHQWIVEKAIEHVIQKQDGKARQYADLLRWNEGHLVNRLKSGVWQADNSGMKCSWSFMFIGIDSDDCDSLHHYGKFGVIETNLGADGANPGELTAPVYADGLYELAVKFWPGGETPSLERLRYVDAGYIMSTGLDIFLTSLMNTYIGGLPHCEGHFYEIYYQQYYQELCEKDWYLCYFAPVSIAIMASNYAQEEAKNTCPVWPPGIAVDSQGKQTMESIENALFYLGWALHMIQDLTVPYHALNQATLSHRDWESSITELWRQGRFDHLPLGNDHNCWAGPEPQYTDVYEFAKAVSPEDFALAVRDSAIDCGNTLGYTDYLKEVLLDLAIKASAALIEKFFFDIGPAQDDSFEENDAWYQVRFIDPGRYSGLIVYPGDDDWYRFYVPSDYSDIVIDVIYDAPMQDNWPWLWPWLIVHEPTGDHALGGQRTPFGKGIELRGAKAGFYELQIEGKIPLKYELVISVIQGPLPEDSFEQWGGNDTPETATLFSDLRYYESACYEDLNIDRPGDDDYYSFSIPEGKWRFEASVTYNPNDGRVSVSANGKEPWIRQVNGDGTETVKMGVCVSDGSALVRVWGARNYYKLCVMRYIDPSCGDVPRLNVDPTSLLFGTYNVGESTNWKIIRISNEGTAALNISQISLTDSINFELGLQEGDNPCGNTEVSLSPTASCTVGVRFKPHSASKIRSALKITSNDPLSPSASVYVAGTGAVIRITSPQLWLYKCDGQMNFNISGAVGLYFVDWLSCYQTILPERPGPVLCSYDFPLPDNFHVDYKENSVSLRVEGCVPDSLVALQLRVRDSRGVEGAKDIEVVVPEPDISVSHRTIDFGDVTVGPIGGSGWPTAVRTVDVLNRGTGPLRINVSLQVPSGSGDIRIRNNCPEALEPYGTCSIDAIYKPTVEGEVEAVLRIGSNDPDQEEIDVQLKGRGVRRPQISYMIFGDPLEVGVGGRGSLRINLQNKGSGLLEIRGISVAGSADFSIARNTCLEPLPYYPPFFGECYVIVTFSPSVLGTGSANVIVESNDPSRPSVTIPVSGTGVAPFLAANTYSLDFAEAGKRLCFQIKNTSGSSSLSWNLDSSLPSWLKASESEGVMGPGTSKGICLFVDRSSLNAGQNYGHTVAITSNGGTVSIPVSMIVPVPLATFAKYYGAEGDDCFFKIRTTSDGGLIAVGSTDSFGSGPLEGVKDAWVVKMDSSGYVEWSKTYGSYWYFERAYDVRETPDGGFIVIAGTSGFTTEGQYGVWIFKLDPYGDIEWEKVYETSSGCDDNQGEWGKEFSIQMLEDGFLVAGNVWGEEGLRVWLMKLKGDGELEWEKSYGTSGSDFANSVLSTSDGGYVILGTTMVHRGGKDVEKRGPAEGDLAQLPSFQPHSDIWVLKLLNNGEVQWEKRYGTGFDEFSYEIKQTSDGGFILIGTTFSTVSAWILKLDAEGDVQWQRSYGGCDANYYGAYGHSILQTPDGGFIFAGVLSNRVSGDDLWLVKVDEKGNVEWQRVYGGGGSDVAYSLHQIPGSGYVVTGCTSSFRFEVPEADYDAFVLKVDAKGNTGECEFVGSTSVGSRDTDVVPDETSSAVGNTDTGVYPTLAGVALQGGQDLQGLVCAAYGFKLSVSKTGGGAGYVASEPGGISCGEDCEELFLPNSSVVLSAFPADGSRFVGWSGDCAPGGGSQVQVTMDSDKSCTAAFDRLSGPDLVGAWGRVILSKDHFIRSTLKITNMGDVPTSRVFWVSFYLSEDNVLDKSDQLISRFFVGQKLRPNKAKVIPFIYHIKKREKGKYILAIVDSRNQIEEIDEANNIAVMGPVSLIRGVTWTFPGFSDGFYLEGQERQVIFASSQN